MIIVTGGAGFIGSNIVAALEKAGKKDIVVVDTLGSSDKWKNIAKRELCAVVPPEDMLDYMETHAEEIEAVIHMGAISATTETGCGSDHPDEFYIELVLVGILHPVWEAVYLRLFGSHLRGRFHGV